MKVKAGLVDRIEKLSVRTQDEISWERAFKATARILCHVPWRGNGMSGPVEVHRPNDLGGCNGTNPHYSIFSAARIEEGSVERKNDPHERGRHWNYRGGRASTADVFQQRNRKWCDPAVDGGQGITIRRQRHAVGLRRTDADFSANGRDKTAVGEHGAIETTNSDLTICRKRTSRRFKRDGIYMTGIVTVHNSWLLIRLY